MKRREGNVSDEEGRGDAKRQRREAEAKFEAAATAFKDAEQYVETARQQYVFMREERDKAELDMQQAKVALNTLRRSQGMVTRFWRYVNLFLDCFFYHPCDLHVGAYDIIRLLECHDYSQAAKCDSCFETTAKPCRACSLPECNLSASKRSVAIWHRRGSNFPIFRLFEKNQKQPIPTSERCCELTSKRSEQHLNPPDMMVIYGLCGRCNKQLKKMVEHRRAQFELLQLLFLRHRIPSALWDLFVPYLTITKLSCFVCHAI